MVENRKRDSVQVNEAGKAALKKAKATQRNYEDKPLRYLDIGVAANVDAKTVERFFKGILVERSSAFAIAQALGLKLEDLIDLPEIPEPEIETALDWREICNREFQKQLEINRRRRQATEKATELGIHVPLGLVERKQQSRSQSRDFSPEMGMEAYQPASEVVEKTYQHQQFLEEIIGGVGKAEKKGVAIIGEPGAGKTTLLEQIGRYLQENDALPIFIPLTNLGEKSLKEYLLTQWGEQNITLSQLEELLQTQRVWFLLDGVDEMAQASPLDTVYRQTLELQQARVVLTCRLNVWDASTKNLPNFQTFKTLEFSEEQVQKFIYQWFGEEQLWERLKEPGKERLRDLVKNPLRLSLLCQTWEYEKELPETQAVLYERFVRYFYDWKPQEFPVTLTQQQELNAALARLALEAIDKGKTRFRISQRFALGVMGEEWLNLGRYVGWLNQVDRDKDTEEAFYAFYHPTFQEYFAALAVEDWSFFLTHVPENPQQGVYRIFEPQWKQVILLWLGRGEMEPEEKEEFIQTLVEFDDECRDFFYYQAYFLAAAGIAEFKACTKADEIVGQIVEWSFGYFNIEKQQWQTFLESIQKGARSTLPQTIRTKAISKLTQVLNTCSDEDIRSRAAESLGEIAVGNESAIAALVQILATTESEDIRDRAFYSLWEIDVGNKSAIAALIQLLAPTESEDIRWVAAYSLGEIAAGNKSAIAALVQLLALTESEDIRRVAAYSLGKIDVGNKTAIAALVQLLATTESKDIRCMAAESLGEIDVGNKTAIAALVQLLASTESEDVRWRAAYILGKIDVGNESAIAALVQLLATTESEDIRSMAAESLGKIDDKNETAIAALVQLLATTESEDIRRRAADSLGKIIVTKEQYAGVVSALKDCLADDVYPNNFRRFAYCYKVIWHCAQNLSYPDFYQAWHHPTLTPHPEMQETTSVGATPEALLLNWDNFPQNLAQALKEQLELADKISVICIDASQFLNPDNPASEIYAKLVTAGYPRCADGTPRDLQSLKVYCELECPEACLIFYEAPSNPPPQGFSPAFLNALSRFSPANRIAIVSEKPDSSVQTFSPTQPNLIPTLIAWMRGTVLEG
ncbi:MAG: NACHT domain-containing protein [Desertifilum sp. SIO1I2]|nr:NACHT domain-containing protein [Desertifilum sp. SIO1I2]